VLRERTNAGFSRHGHASVIFDDLKLDVLDGMAIRLGYSQFAWSKAIVRYTSCTPVERIDGNFEDATTVYEEIGSICCDGHCLVKEGYDPITDVSQLDLPKLRVFTADVDALSHLLRRGAWTVWTNAGGGLTIATFDDPSAE
jgi:hypothetical protein